jgi:3-hydroxyacyl-CoA dehydrogenase
MAEASTTELVSFSQQGAVGVITINNPPVNALSPGVPEGILKHVQRAATDASIKALVLIGGGRTFIAGADIREFGKMTSGKRERLSLNPLLATMEDSAKPIVAAIHGTAFGGGLEFAMACQYRVAIASAQVGQPEVKLGLIPGAGGTQRLPRLAGVAKALEMCAGGDPIGAREALAAGVVDRVVEGTTGDDLLAGAVKFAAEVISSGGPHARTRDKTAKLADAVANAAAIAAARDALKKKGRVLIAPAAAIEAIEATTRESFDEGLAKEAELFEKCLFSEQSKSLIHAFFGERAVAKIPGIGKDVPLIPIKRAAVVGAGTMGGGIAMNYANVGIPVLIKETSQELLDKGLATIAKNYANSVKKGRFSQEEMDRRLSLITPTLTYDGFDTADIVAEAVFEGMELKKKVFAELETVTKPTAILASNTSTLNIDEIASATSRPQQVIGHHYFSPANVMRLLEIVRGKASSPEVIATSMDLSRKLKKVGVLVGNCRGFVGNRMFGPYRREAQFLVEEGAGVDAVDAALYEFGMAMGPLATGDLAGLDVGWRIRKEYKHTEVAGVRYPEAEDRLCEMGRYGQKTGAGWYKYDENRQRHLDPEVERIVLEVAKERGIPRRVIDNQEIVDRCIYALVNEGARILEEGFALRAVDIDIIYLNGYGFPAWRGGPMWYADTMGLQNVYERIGEFFQAHGYHWEPAPLLKQLAQEGKTFADWDKGRE